MDVLPTSRIVLLGKQGAGKSSLANTIFGETVFKINRSSKSPTSKCQTVTKTVNGRSVSLIDTPGFCDPGSSKEAMKTEMIRCLTECAPGPHAFLIVLKVERFTEQEQAVIKNILRCFSEAALRYSAVVFTHGERLHEGMKIEEFVSQNKHLSDLVKKCSGRCLVVDNEHWNNSSHIYRRNRVQVAELLNTIDKMVKENKGGYYTNEMLQVIKNQMQTQCDSQSAGHTPKEETSNKAINAISKNVWIKLTGPAAESMAKAFSGPAVVAVQENREATRGAEEGTAEEDSTAGVEAVSGPPSRIVITGAAGAGKRIRVLKNYRIVLLGRTGAGKSSLANTIFGEDVFKINHTLIRGPGECQPVSKSVEGRRITLINTPGFCDFSTTEEELRRDIVRCFSDCAPGPHAFFIVFKVEKFTQQEMAVITKILQYFSEEALKYAAVVFTHGNHLPEGMKIEEFVDQNKCLSDLVKKCGGRCHVVDNKCWKDNEHDEYRSNRFQVAELLNTTDKIVMENKGGCYTSEMLQAVEREIEEENMTQGDTSSTAVNSVSKNVWIKLTGPAAKPLAEAFFRPAVVVLQETGEAVEERGAGDDGGEDEETAETEEDASEEETATETEEEAATEEEGEEEREEEEKDSATGTEDESGEEEKQRESETGTEKDTHAKAKQGGQAGGGGLLGTLLGWLFGGAAGAAGAFAAAVGAVVGGAVGAGAAAAALIVAGAGTAITAIFLTLGAIGGGVWGMIKIAAIIKWVRHIINRIKVFLKDLPRHIGIILLVVVFCSLLLLSFCAQLQIVGTPFFLFGASILLLLLVLLFLVL